MDTQMKKGVLEMCILYQCSQRDRYGYEILKLIQDAFPSVHDGSIYAILRRLHADGYTETYFGEASGGPRRKYYRITTSGSDYLNRTIDEWRSMMVAVQQLGIE